MTGYKTMRNTSAAFMGLLVLLLTLATVPQPALGADGVTDANVAEKGAIAATPADHEALAVYFTTKAGEAAAEIKLHENMRSRMMGKNRARMNSHCRQLIQAARSEQEAYEDLADLHRELGKEAHK